MLLFSLENRQTEANGALYARFAHYDSVKVIGDQLLR